jgi:glycosyltransferase involved in cell wall biosynthesis
MTAFNREHFIADAIESVLNSTLQSFELIVVDDDSSDGTLLLAQEYQSKDKRVRVFSNPANLGDYPNRNKAAAYAEGTYLKYVDSDDIIYPHGLAAMVACMEAYPDAGVGLSAIPDTVGPYPRLLSPYEAYREHFFGEDLLGRAPGSAIIKRRSFESVGGFSGKRQVGDHELWLRIARTFSVVKMPTDLVWDRMHPLQEKHYDDEAEKAAMHDFVRLAALHAEDCPLSKIEIAEAIARLQSNQARLYLSLLRKRSSRKDAFRFRKAVGISRSAIVSAAVNRLLQ